MKILILLLISSINLNFGTSFRLLYRGRLWNGNLAIPYHVNSYNLPVAEYFEQPLDHFNPQDTRTWQQKYYRNATFFARSQAPLVFLMIGGEAAANPIWSVTGTWIEYAKQFNALCFQLEHRYYGDSHPTPDLSTDNLKWLTSEQALADISNFIMSMNNQIRSNYQLGNNVPKWIVFGGSYPGSLAAWARLKYPHLIYGAISTSGPLVALEDFKEYYMVVKKDLQITKKGCANAVEKSFQELTTLLSSNDHTKFFSIFESCASVYFDSKNISNIFETLASNFAGVAQYNRDNRQFEGVKDGNITLEVVCDIMLNDSEPSFALRLAKFNQIIMEVTNQTCVDFSYSSQIKTLKSVEWHNDGSRQWTYQTCTEFGFFQTSSGLSLFGSKNSFPVDFFINQCQEIFGENFNSTLLKNGVYRTNSFYGGMNIQADRIVFIHGSVDPWHALGITKAIRKESPAVYIKGTAHCANMYPESDSDLQQLQAARQFVAKTISYWLKNSNYA